MAREELQEILEKHKHFLARDCEGWQSMRADLSCASLRYADLRCADLRHADLRHADLRGADLRGANLYKADLRGADLREANLYKADLRGANLYKADLREANLYGVNLCGAKNVPFIPYACPDHGAFIGYKKCRNNLIVELEIPADAKRLSAAGHKCRCDKAKVLRILNFDRTVSEVEEAISRYDEEFIYKVGETVSVPNFDEDRWNECSSGIHFFINFQEAVDY